MGKKTFYFIGINGIGMSGLAEILVKQGHHVIGSDYSKNIPMDYFKSLGINVHQEQKKENIESDDWTVVVSSAIKSNHEELLEAQQIGCVIIKRGKLLAEIAHEFNDLIAVVGTHGKTTTTSMIVKIFSECIDPPSYFIGGHLTNQPHACIQSKTKFITELDESDGSFLDIVPSDAIITNIEHDHVDYYETKEQVINAFALFIDRTIQKGGRCTLNLDDPLSEKLYKKSSSKDSFITYAIENNQANIQAKNIEYNWSGVSFTLVVNQTDVELVQLNLYGRHNIYNALAAISVAISKEVSLTHILNALTAFSGLKRRLELKYKSNNILLFDDYAHHPTEIITTLEGIYKSYTKNRIITIFQPHRFSRLSNLFLGFSESFARSEKTLVLPFIPQESRKIITRHPWIW